MNKQKIFLLAAAIVLLAAIFASVSAGSANDLYSGDISIISKGEYSNLTNQDELRFRYDLIDDPNIDSFLSYAYYEGGSLYVGLSMGESYKVWVNGKKGIIQPVEYKKYDNNYIISLYIPNKELENDTFELHVGADSDIYNITLSNISGLRDYIFTDNMITNGTLINDSLVAYWDLNEDAVDQLNINNGTISGAANTTGHFGEENTALSFDGVDDYVEIPNNADFNTSEFSVSFWYKSNGTQIHNKGIISKDVNAIVRQWFIRTESTNAVRFGSYDSDGSPEESVISDTFDSTAWNHIVAVYTGAYKYIYVNGIRGANLDAVNNIKNGTSPIWLGTYYATTGQNFNGSLDNVRFFNKALSAEEIKALYQERDDYYTNGSVSYAFCIKDCINETGLVSQYELNGDADDYYGNYNGTITGASNESDCRYGNCLSFDGSGDWINFGDSVDVTSITYSFWAKYSGAGTSVPINKENSYRPIMFFSNGDIQHWIGNSTTWQTIGPYPGGFSNNQWHHWVVSYDENTGAFDVYRDGLNILSQTHSLGPLVNNAQILYFGRTNAGDYFNGSIDNVIIWNRSLSQDEVYNLYLSGYEHHLENGTLHRIDYDGDVSAKCSFLNTSSAPFNDTYDLEDSHYANFTGYYLNSASPSWTSYSSGSTINEQSDYGICEVSGSHFSELKYTFADFTSECTEDANCSEGYQCVSYQCVPIPPPSMILDAEINITEISEDGANRLACIKSDGYLGTCAASEVYSSGTCTCS